MNTTPTRPLDPPRDTPKPARSPELAQLTALLELADELESAARDEGRALARAPYERAADRAACARTDAARAEFVAGLMTPLGSDVSGPVTIGGAR